MSSMVNEVFPHLTIAGKSSLRKYTYTVNVAQKTKATLHFKSNETHEYDTQSN